MQQVLAARFDELSELYSGLITHGSQPGNGNSEAGVPCAHALWMVATRGAAREVRVPRRSEVTLDTAASVTYVTSLTRADVARCFADARAEALLRECGLRLLLTAP